MLFMRAEWAEYTLSNAARLPRRQPSTNSLSGESPVELIAKSIGNSLAFNTFGQCQAGHWARLFYAFRTVDARKAPFVGE